MKTIMKAAALLAATSLLVLAGCKNSVTPPPVQPGGSGTVRLSVGMPLDRTIMPDTTISDFTKFRISFTSADENPLNTPVVTVLDGGQNQVSKDFKLEVGDWKVHVTAFLETPPDDAALESMKDEVAISSASAMYVSTITVISAVPVTVNASLHRIGEDEGGGNGKFEGDFTFEPGIILSAEMDVFKAGNSSASVYSVSDLLANMKTSTDLPAGFYDVKVIMENNEGEKVTRLETLHVYQNMTSTYKYDFGQLDFPQTVLQYILASWDPGLNGGSWDFVNKGITAEWFKHVEAPIVGVDDIATDPTDINDAAFTGFTGMMNSITRGSQPPAGRGTLRDLIDVALVQYAVEKGSFEVSEYNTLAEVKAKLETYAVNAQSESIVVDISDSGTGTGDSITLTVTIGDYRWDYSFAVLNGTVTITGADEDDIYRVGDNLKAVPSFTTGGSGKIEYEWVSYGHNDYNTSPPPDGDAIYNGLHNVLADRQDADDTYTMEGGDEYNYITVAVYSIGDFGHITANVAGPVRQKRGSSTVNINLEIVNDAVLNLGEDGTISLINNPGKQLVITVGAGGEGVLGNYVRWYRNDGTEITTNRDALSLLVSDKTYDVHDGRIGTHTITVEAIVDGKPVGMGITFEVKP